MRGIVEETLNVKKLRGGYIYGHSGIVKTILLYKDNEHIVVEVRFSVDLGTRWSLRE